MNLRTIADVGQVPKGFRWESERRFVDAIQFIMFAIATGDWNKVHINPLSAWRYCSNLGGLTCCADFVLALTKPGIHKALSIGEDCEIIATGYEKVALLRPLNLGSSYSYSYTLMKRTINKGIAYCTWLIEVHAPSGDLLASAEYKMLYKPVRRKDFRTVFTAWWRKEALGWACICFLAAILALLCQTSELVWTGP